MPSKYKRHCLTIEVQGQPDCGYSLAFTSSLKDEFRDPGLLQWRKEVTAAVFKSGSRVFGTQEQQYEALSELLEALTDINSRHSLTVKSLRGVPAIQIESVDGRRIEVQFSGKVDKSIAISLSRKTLAVPNSINGHGSGTILAAQKADFPFIGPERAVPAAADKKGKKNPPSPEA